MDRPRLARTSKLGRNVMAKRERNAKIDDYIKSKHSTNCPWCATIAFFANRDYCPSLTRRSPGRKSVDVSNIREKQAIAREKCPFVPFRRALIGSTPDSCYPSCTASSASGSTGTSCSAGSARWPSCRGRSCRPGSRADKARRMSFTSGLANGAATHAIVIGVVERLLRQPRVARPQLGAHTIRVRVGTEIEAKVAGRQLDGGRAALNVPQLVANVSVAVGHARRDANRRAIVLGGGTDRQALRLVAVKVDSTAARRRGRAGRSRRRRGGGRSGLDRARARKHLVRVTRRALPRLQRSGQRAILEVEALAAVALVERDRVVA